MCLRHFEQFFVAGAVAQFFGKDPQVRGARILGAINAMAETGNLHLARQGALHPVDRGFFAGELQQDLDDVLIGAAV